MSRSHGTQAPALQARDLQHRHDDSSPPPWQAADSSWATRLTSP
ncbi:hypothetical protein [Streptomyces sp. NL15-2K]|nr:MULTISPECIES: hypothetical protein [Actinomycetes]WKX07206.1 hypothetical protein Q4V64_06785 [Kutzneria buriramensis]GCB51597.1 hypothetical protein SNL152K_8953 [Streptomyces sp. NL15-2K]